MGKINAEWHRANMMPKTPTNLQRAQWHYEHAKHCGCRKMTPIDCDAARGGGHEGSQAEAVYSARA